MAWAKNQHVDGLCPVVTPFLTPSSKFLMPASLSSLQRDIKTGNIFLCAEGHVQLGDFGLASVRDARDAASSHDQSLVGVMFACKAGWQPCLDNAGLVVGLLGLYCAC